MIDRKALWIFIAVILAMTGATIWQPSLLTDWRQLPLGGPGSHNTVSGLVRRTGLSAALLGVAVHPMAGVA